MHKTGEIKQCKQCSKDCYVPGWRAERWKYCSPACLYAGRPKPKRKETELTCRFCGSLFRVPPYRAKTAKFCSLRCGLLGKPEVMAAGPKAAGRVSAARAMPKEERKRRKHQTDRNRYAARRGSEEQHTDNDLAEIMRMQNARCAICYRKFSIKLKATVDHIKPLSKGGSNGRRNLQLTCRQCNSAKHDSDPSEFMRTRGRLL